MSSPSKFLTTTITILNGQRNQTNPGIMNIISQTKEVLVWVSLQSLLPTGHSPLLPGTSKKRCVTLRSELVLPATAACTTQGNQLPHRQIDYHAGRSMLPDIRQHSFPEMHAFLFLHNDRIINSLSEKDFSSMSGGPQRMESYCPQMMKFTDSDQNER